MSLTEKNFQSGFLVDDELLASVVEEPLGSGKYVAYVLKHSTGEYLGYRKFDHLNDALYSINQIEREWKFEKTGGCDGGNCGKKCSGGKCGS